MSWPGSVGPDSRPVINNMNVNTNNMNTTTTESLTLQEQGQQLSVLEAFAGCCKVGITELDRLVHAARKAADPKATTKASREWLRQLLAEYGESKTTKGSVKEVEGGAA